MQVSDATEASHVRFSDARARDERKETDYLEELAFLFVRIHNSVVVSADRYLSERGRAVYLTPARCKEALEQFERLVTT